MHPAEVSMARILVIEDEQDIQEVLQYNLRAAGYEVASAFRGLDGLRRAREQRPDLVLLDLMLPDLPGTEVCRQLRASADTRDVPVLMLTAKHEEIDRVVGFEVGADDYVTKPFSIRELVLRIGAILRRGREDARTETAPLVEFGCLRIDHHAHRTWVEDRELELTPLEFKLLTALYERKNRVQARDVLLSEVWGMPREITTRTVDTHIKRLREKLGPAGRYIQTVRGVGYRFAPSPEAAAEGDGGEDLG
jgi:two-component system phosphate regulon response regulator PhoB